MALPAAVVSFKVIPKLTCFQDNAPSYPFHGRNLEIFFEGIANLTPDFPSCRTGGVGCNAFWYFCFHSDLSLVRSEVCLKPDPCIGSTPHPGCNRHHQDDIFSREFLQTFICHCYWVGGRSNVSTKGLARFSRRFLSLV